MAIKSNYYQAFNNFQTAFYTNKTKFKDYTKFEVKKHGYVLLNNMSKGFPNLADLITNLHSFTWKGTESKQILIALQGLKFVNGFSQLRVPKFIYYLTPKKPKTKSKSRKNKKGLDFDLEIKVRICELLMYDNKTYESLKYSGQVQEIGKQLIGEFMQKEKLKRKKKK